MADAAVTVDTAAAAAALGVSVDSFRHLAARHKLVRYGTVRRAKYDLAQVAALNRVIWGDVARAA